MVNVLLRTACFCFVFHCILTIALAQNPSPEQDLAGRLIAATDEGRAQVLEASKPLINIDLRKALTAEGNRLQQQSDFAHALAAYQLAKQVAEQIGDSEGIGTSLIDIGVIYSIQGSNVKSVEFYQQGLETAEKSGNKAVMARALRNIGNSKSDLGYPDDAVVYFQKSLAIAEEIGDKTQTASAWNNIGVVYMYEGNYRPALDYLQKALNVRESMGNKPLIASSLNNIALVYDSQGNYAQALEYYRRSLKLREELGDRADIANVLNNMGDYRLLGSYDLALEYNRKSLAIAEEIGDQALIGRALGNIGNAYRGKGDYGKALEFGLKSLEQAEKIGDKEVLANEDKHVANAYFGKGEYQKSLEYAERGVATAREINSRQSLWTSLDAKGKAYSALHQPEQAQQAFEEAIATIENWRSLVAGDESEEQGLFSEKLDAYHDMILLLIAENRNTEAVQYAERAKARVLLDVLHSGRINIYKTMTSREREQEQSWNKQLVSLNKHIQQEKLNDKPDPILLTRLDSELQEARLKFESFRNELYAAHPELRAQRGEAEVIKTEDIGALIPDVNSAIVEYVVTEDKTLAFVLRKAGESPPFVATAYAIDIKEDDLSARIVDFRRRIADRDVRFKKPSAELFNLLMQPLAKDLQGINKMIIVPDGVLWELPFQALISPMNRYVLEDRSISYVPSLTVLHEMRTVLRKESRNTAGRLFALGNPTLSDETRRQVTMVYRSEVLAPLPEAEREVKALARLYGTEASKIYTGDMAREDRVKDEAGRFSVLHIASHAIVDDATPMYSQVLLARDSASDEDGVLEAREIVNLKLKADLVVLSACETALGKVRKGEGMIGLTWAFFVTGTSAEVVSQWKVESEGTTSMMLFFHRGLKSNISRAEALRNAELKLLRNRKYSHPFYWAPFVLIGDGY